MKTKTIIGKDGRQAGQIVIEMKGTGGELGIGAVENLIMTINNLKKTQTEEEAITQFYIIRGYAYCCRDCGFLEKENVEELLELTEFLVGNELKRIEAKGGSGNGEF